VLSTIRVRRQIWTDQVMHNFQEMQNLLGKISLKNPLKTSYRAYYFVKVSHPNWDKSMRLILNLLDDWRFLVRIETLLTVRIEAIRMLKTLFPIRYTRLSLMIFSLLDSMLNYSSSNFNEWAVKLDPSLPINFKVSVSSDHLSMLACFLS